MKIASRTVLFAAFFTLLAQFAAAQVPSFSPFSADLQITTTRGGGAARDITGKLYAGSGHLRLDMSTAGHESAIITDFATKTTDILMIEQQMYIERKSDVNPARGPGSNVAADMKPYDPQNPCANQTDITCKKIGVEEVSGRTCDHWEVTDKNGKVSNLWIDQKLHFPVKVTSQDSTMLLTNIREGQPDASLFKVPADFHKVDMSSMLPPGAVPPPQK